MSESAPHILEGVFAVNKPSSISSAQVVLDLQSIFYKSRTFAPLLVDTVRKREEQERHQPKGQKRKNEEEEGRFFKMGHGGTLDPLASGVLIVGIGRGTKKLHSYLRCTKTYETVVLFGKCSDTYDVDGSVMDEKEFNHVTRDLVEKELDKFRNSIQQTPPIYSALKINGVKACEYVREGKKLPRELQSREMQVHECTLLEWYHGGQHEFRWPGDNIAALAPAVKIRLSVSSGFYVRSFAHDLGIACGSYSLMASLERLRQATFIITEPPENPELLPALKYSDLKAEEEIWGPKLTAQLSRWVEENPATGGGHVNGRDLTVKRRVDSDRNCRYKQRFRGEWTAETKQERIKQQGGKFKGKWNTRKHERQETPEINSTTLIS